MKIIKACYNRIKQEIKSNVLEFFIAILQIFSPVVFIILFIVGYVFLLTYIIDLLSIKLGIIIGLVTLLPAIFLLILVLMLIVYSLEYLSDRINNIHRKSYTTFILDRIRKTD